jgi:dipeptidyl aminopeptidase/acylaminoacyl peptidase
MLRLAGLRINPRTNGPHLGTTITGISLIRIEEGRQIAVSTPPGARMSQPRWSPDGKWFAFTNTTGERIDLWLAETETGRTKLIAGLRVNAAFGETIQWMPDSRHLLLQTVPPGRGAAPVEPRTPSGPRIQESAGKPSPVRTYQDLLTSTHDEDLFDYHMTAQVMLVDAAAGNATAFGEPGIYSSIEPSPDGQLVLFTRLNRPYSFLYTHTSFPREIGVWNRNGKLASNLFTQPLRESVPIEGVAPGPRSITWRPDEPATLTWVEALDEGNPRNKAPHRDRLMSWKAPFTGQAAEWMRLEHRFLGIDWGQGVALVRDSDRNRRWVRTFALATNDRGATPKLLFSRSSQDQYGDPGSPVEITNPAGARVLLQDGDSIFLNGDGATPEGARPFLDKYNWRTGENKRLFLASKGGYERVRGVLDAHGSRLLTERESSTEPPNYFVRAEGASPRALTDFRDPTPQLRRIQKRLVNYKRPDGVNLSFTLYLPPDYREGTRLPAVVWAYPREYVDADTAGQFGGSTERFTMLTGASHLFFLLAGYAVLDGASMPVVGPPETVNNTYVEQIVASAKAAIDKGAEMGVIDPTRVGVGGHSYGAFMTANLLAHSDLFRAGIARSGAYNRTLTPFGFQAERRTIWEAQSVYLRMSPFLVADKIKEPLLLIHGEADNNSGTFPIQSDRMYQAVRGNGGTVRLVMLPHESHGYSGKESVEHTLAEMIGWFDRYVKSASAVTGGSR